MTMSTSLQSVAVVTTDLICTLDQTWVIGDANPAFEDRLGWPVGRVKGRVITDFVAEDDRGSVRAALSRLRGAVRYVEVRCRCRRADGSLVWIDWRATLHEDSVFAVGREMPEHDEGISAVVHQAVRQQIAEEERRRLSVEEERAHVNSALLESQHRANLAQTKARTLQTWVAAAVAVIGMLAGGAVWAINRVEESAITSREAQYHRERVDGDLQQLTSRMHDNEKKIHRLGRAVVEIQIQVSEGTKYLADKIDAASPRSAKKVEPPPTVTQAHTRVDELKRSIQYDDAFASDSDDGPSGGGTDGP